MELLHRDSGKVIDHPEDDSINQAIASGDYAPPAGVRIPVINPEGELKTLPSEQLESAFNNGFKWATPDARNAWMQAKLQDINQKNFGDMPITAGLAGAADMMTGGLSNAYLQSKGFPSNQLFEQNKTPYRVGEAIGVAPALLEGGLGLAGKVAGKALVPEALSTAARLTNPIAVIAAPLGKAAGELAKPVGESLESLAFGKNAAEGAQLTDAAAEAGYATPLKPTFQSTAQKLVRNTPSNIVGSAAEAAAYSLAPAVSEAALGDPQDAAENFVSTLLMGTTLGGVLGTTFRGLGDAAPLIRDISKAATGQAGEMVNNIAKGTYNSLAKKVLQVTGNGALSSDLEQLVYNATPEERAAVMDQGSKAVNALDKEASRAQSDLEQHTQDLGKQIEYHIKTLPAQEQSIINEQLAKTSGDTSEAVQNMYKEHQALDAAVKSDWRQSNQPAQVAGYINNRTNELIDHLSNSKTEAATKLAQSLQSSLDGELAHAGVVKPPLDMPPEMAGKYLNDSMKLEQEIAMGRNMKSTVQDAVGQGGWNDFSARDREAIRNYQSDLENNALKGTQNPDGSWSGGHPNPIVREQLQQLDTRYKAMSDLSKAVLGKGAPEVIGKMKPIAAFNRVAKGAAPEFADKLNRVMDNAEQFMPELKNIKEGFNSAVERKNNLQSALSKYVELKGASPGNRMSPYDMEQILNMLGADSKHGLADISDLRKAQAALAQTQDMPAVSKVVVLRNALGQPIDEHLQSLINLDKSTQAAARLKDAEVQRGAILKSLPWVGGALGGASGGAAGALEGYAAGNKLSNAAIYIANPLNSLKTLSVIERTINKSAQMVDKNINRVVKTLSNPGVIQTAERLAPLSMEDARKDFPKQAELLTKLADPQTAANYAANRLGTWQGAPKVQAAVTAQLLNTAQFLASKLPKNPLSGQDPFNTEPWTPSDQQLHQFNRYVQAAQNPLSTMKHIVQGTQTNEEVQTLQTLYPSMYKKLQIAVMNGIKENEVKPTYAQRVNLGTVLNIPADPTLQPTNIMKLQANHVAEQPEQQGGRPEGKSIKIDLDPMNNIATETTRITNK